MELRNHPLMRRHGISNWPPIWSQHGREGDKRIRGECGVLRYVHANQNISNKCYLVIEHEAEHFVGCLIFDDVAFCSYISTLLQDHIGHSIKEIGDLDLSGSL
jgi:hypothetical protein